MSTDLSTQQQHAAELFEQKKYSEALAAYIVLRKLRARKEGPESLMYLSNTHSAVYCLSRLNRWTECIPLLKELSTTRERILGPADESTIDAKRWWVWACRETNDFSKASDIEIEIADAFYTIGNSQGAARAIATAIYYQNKTETTQPTKAVEEKAKSANNSEVLKTIAKKVGAGALTAGVTASFEGVIGGLFN